MKKHLLYYISPCVLASVFCLLAIITGFVEKQSSDGWSMVLVVLFLPSLFVLLIADFVVKLTTKGNLLLVWIIEVVLVAIMIIFNKLYFF